jgi:hypothetical protein
LPSYARLLLWKPQYVGGNFRGRINDHFIVSILLALLFSLLPRAGLSSGLGNASSLRFLISLKFDQLSSERSSECIFVMISSIRRPCGSAVIGTHPMAASVARTIVRPPNEPGSLFQLRRFQKAFRSSKPTLIFRYFLRYFSSTHRTDLSRFRGTFHSFRSCWLCYFRYFGASNARAITFKYAFSPITEPPKPCRPCGIGVSVIQPSVFGS